MLRRVPLLTLSGLLALLATWPASAQQPSKPELDRNNLLRLEQQIEALRNRLKIPGLQAVVLRDQRVIWANAFGHADLENRIPETVTTPQHIASLTKTFAATLVMQLVDHGDLSLDEPVSHYSSDFKDDHVKIKHLLSHTSEGNPGDAYSYSGERYDYLTAVLEKKTGKPFRQLMVETFLDLLGMADSVPGHDLLTDGDKWASVLGKNRVEHYQKVLTRLAQPYRLYGDEIIHAPYPPRDIRAAAGLISTVGDMAKYDVAIDQHRFLKKETQERMWTPFTSNSGKPLPHGLGWFSQTYRGERLIWHYGYWPDSFSATYVKIPSRNLSFILLANSDAASAPFYYTGGIESSVFACSFLRLFLFQDVLSETLPDPNWSLNEAGFAADLTLVRQRATGYDYGCEELSHAAMEKWLSEKHASAHQEIKLDASLLTQYTGQYRLNPHRVYTVTVEGGHPWIDIPRDFESELFAQGEDRFFLKTFDMEVTFVRDKNRKIERIECDASGDKFSADRLP
jgi:CubicO group peptidase (beta-lactamase class C family)